MEADDNRSPAGNVRRKQVSFRDHVREMPQLHMGRLVYTDIHQMVIPQVNCICVGNGNMRGRE